MKNFFRILNTVKFLKIKQIFFLIYYKLKKYRQYKEGLPKKNNLIFAWISPNYILPSTFDGKTFDFIGVKVNINGKWNLSTPPKLWLYNLHYQNDLVSIGNAKRFILCKKLVDDWIKFNPPYEGNGWEPYCISIRIVNWIKWISNLDKSKINVLWLHSLAIQADALYQKPEYHIMGNHLFSNAKALIFAGVFFDGKQSKLWLKKGISILDKELEAQFLEDGSHFELSPMYHSLILWDIADLIHLQKITKHQELNKRIKKLKKLFLKGFEWAKNMVHPDKNYAFFNDTTLGVAPKLSDLLKYASFLKINTNRTARKINYLEIITLKSSGYYIINWPNKHKLFIDLAHVGPKYQPGHAHADTLSCELSLYGQRLLVNSGISVYSGDYRKYQRSTSAHNTLEIDGKNSSDVWADFRVARRAKPFDIILSKNKNELKLKASHDGYQTLLKKIIHQREWVLRNNQVSITDTIGGKFSFASAFWHLHPEVKIVQLDKTTIKVTMKKKEIIKLKFEGATIDIVSGIWHPGFGVNVSNKKIILKMINKTLVTHIFWGLN